MIVVLCFFVTYPDADRSLGADIVMESIMLGTHQ